MIAARRSPGGVFVRSPGGVRGREADVFDGFNARIRDIAIDANGKIVCVGDFTEYGSVACQRIARLNTDGGLDTSFNSEIAFNNTVSSVAIDANGKIVCGGQFTRYAGTDRVRVARLNTDGSLDATFEFEIGFNDTVLDIAIDANGKIVCVGAFVTPARYRITRLNTDGSPDNSYDPISGGFNDRVHAVLIDASGKIICGGNFTGLTHNRIARRNDDGSTDASFSSGEIGYGFDFAVFDIAIDASGKIVCVGDFTEYDQTTFCRRVARLNTDGRIDTTFDSDSGFESFVYSVAIDANGKIVCGGDFRIHQHGGVDTDSQCIARLNTDGSLDTAFNSANGFNVSTVAATAIDANGKIVCGGNFTSYGGVKRDRVARLNTDGSLDTSFRARAT